MVAAILSLRKGVHVQYEKNIIIYTILCIERIRLINNIISYYIKIICLNWFNFRKFMDALVNL